MIFMKILIIGHSGSGKSTLASQLAKLYHVSCLHLDKISFYPNWIEKENEKKISALKEFLSQNPKGWVIDGTYVGLLFNERVEQADLIIYLNFNRFSCYFSALRRAKSYKNKTRDSAPEGCNENFSLSFQWWILYEGRKKERLALFKKTKRDNPNKTIEFKNRKQVNRYLNQVINYINRM